jgi:uncharacterized protein YegP (UPF0339 family)
MAGKFVLKKGSSGKFHFNLLAGNGQVIATSETYESKQSAMNGINSVKENAPGAEVDDQTDKPYVSGLATPAQAGRGPQEPGACLSTDAW